MLTLVSDVVVGLSSTWVMEQNIQFVDNVNDLLMMPQNDMLELHKYLNQYYADDYPYNKT